MAAGAAAVVKARLDAAKIAEEEEFTFTSEEVEAASTIANLNRSRIAKKRMALRREERRLAKLAGEMDDKPLAGNELKSLLTRKCIKIDELKEVTNSRYQTRRGFHNLWLMMIFTGIMIGSTMTAVGDRNDQVLTEKTLLDNYVFNSTQAWGDVKDKWAFMTWFDDVLLPVTFGEETVVKCRDGVTDATSGTNYTFMEFLTVLQQQGPSRPSSGPNRVPLITGPTDFYMDSSKLVAEWLAPVGDFRLTFTKRATQDCDTKYGVSVGQPYPASHCVSKSSTVETAVALPAPMTLTDVQTLKRSSILDQVTDFAGTILIDMVFYNANSHMLALLELEVDVAPVGTWETSVSNVGALMTEKDKDPNAGLFYFLFSVFGIGTALLTALFAYQLWTQQDFLVDPWNVLDLACIAISWTYIGISIQVQVILDKLVLHGPPYYMYNGMVNNLNNLVEEDTIELIADLQFAYILQVITSVLILLFFIRLCRFVQYEGKIGLVTCMLLASLNDMFHFLVFLMVYMVGCSFACMAVFGHAFDFTTSFNKAMESLFLLGYGAGPFMDNYAAMSQVNPIMTPLVVTLFLVLTALILMNVFVAIIMDAYAEVKPDSKMQYTLMEEAQEGMERRMRQTQALLMGQENQLSDLEDLVSILDQWEIPEGAENLDISYAMLMKKLQGKPLSRRTDALVRQVNEELASLDYDTIHAATKIGNGSLDAGSSTKVAPEPAPEPTGPNPTTGSTATPTPANAYVAAGASSNASGVDANEATKSSMAGQTSMDSNRDIEDALEDIGKA